MNNLISVLSVFFLVFLDQSVKYFLLSWVSALPIQIFSFFSLKLVLNDGIAFSFPFPLPLLLLLSFLFLGVLFFFFLSIHLWTLERIGFLFLLSGGIGNLIDRCFRDGVVDFLSFFQFPIFNIADVCISLGVLYLFFYYAKTDWLSQTQKK